MPDPHGAVLMARLHAVVVDASELLTRLGNVRPGPPITSQERRRVADQADRCKAALDRICHDLDAWFSEPAPDGDRTATTAVVDAGRNASAATAAPEAEPADVASAQEALDRARADLHRAVEGARARGDSWRKIGAALGIAGQTAHKRFDPGARRRHADYMRSRYQRLSER